MEHTEVNEHSLVASLLDKGAISEEAYRDAMDNALCDLLLTNGVITSQEWISFYRGEIGLADLIQKRKGILS